MPILDGIKFACHQCIIGHRTGRCKHNDGRELFPIRSRGRPKTQCSDCQERRRTSSFHSKCSCISTPSTSIAAVTAESPAASKQPCAGSSSAANISMEAARQQGFHISTGPQPRRMRKDRIREKEQGISTVVSLPIAHQAGSAAAAIQQLAATELLAPPTIAPSDDYPPPAPSLSFLAEQSTFQLPYPPQPSTSADSAAALTPPPALPPEPILDQMAANSTSSSAAQPETDEDPNMDALLQAINVVKQGPSAIICSCPGRCKCKSCRGRHHQPPAIPAINQNGKRPCEAAREQEEDCNQLAPCCRPPASADSSPASARATTTVGSETAPSATDSGAEQSFDSDKGEVSDQQRLKRRRIAGNGRGSDAKTNYASDGISGGPGSEASEDLNVGCASCGACDLELSMPSGIPAVDAFAAGAAHVNSITAIAL
ncbi:copper-binding transcription factor [Tilletia horrida]|uniref:Copper-binding transcription factor n=1 Tax=Tilletia horrida TaxID=155126 RepID=A0AAN6GQM4_9BASI|nr:copper-binding transcription factor [Tilletia horrida]KAK0551926.1 copper-binding transcription factor [Tilletia horrida]KAK0568655.1 copper-binding transcription factor [Tilletia horrida]